MCPFVGLLVLVLLPVDAVLAVVVWYSLVV
jgi:hypothetical protein